MTAEAAGGDNRGGPSRGAFPHSILTPLVPRDVVPGVATERRPTITKVPLALEDLFQEIDPDWLGYDATLHSERCYTVILLTLDYQYTAWRCHLSDDGRWTMSPLDWAGTFQLVEADER